MRSRLEPQAHRHRVQSPVVHGQQPRLVQIGLEVVAHRGIPGLALALALALALPVIRMSQLARRLLLVLVLLRLEVEHRHVVQHLAEPVEPVDRVRHAAEGLQRGLEPLDPLEIANVAVLDGVAEEDDKGYKGREKDGPRNRVRTSADFTHGSGQSGGSRYR